MTSVEVQCDKLIEDSLEWRKASDAAKAAKEASEGLTLGPARMGYAAEVRGVIDAYDALKQKFTALLGGAETEFDKIADTLVEVAKTYLREDQAGAHVMLTIERERLR
jgi:hypothetical protein